MLLGIGPIASYPLSSGGSGSIQLIDAVLTASGTISADLEHFAGFLANTVSSGVMASAPVASVPLASNFAGIHNISSSLNSTGTFVCAALLRNIADGLLNANGSLTTNPIIARSVEATLIGGGSINADALHRTPWTSDMFAFGTVDANIQLRLPINATCNGVGSVSPSLVIIRQLATTTLNGTGTVTASATVFKRASCFMVGVGVFNMTLGTEAEARLTAKATIFANATKIYADPIDAGSGFAMMPSVVKQTIKPI